MLVAVSRPKFKALPETPFAKRVRRALEHAQKDATEVAAELTSLLGRPKEKPIKPQTVQYLAQKAKQSHLTPYLARITKVDADWLRDESGPAPHLEIKEAAPSPGTGLLDASARAMIGNRIFTEIQRTKKTPAGVAARLRMSLRDFEERARTGDFSLEDLAELVIFLGTSSLDFIVLGRFPVADTHGPLGDIFQAAADRTASRTTRKTSHEPDTPKTDARGAEAEMEAAKTRIRNLPRHGVQPGAPEYTRNKVRAVK
jgi:hypothetical protein